MSVFFDDWPSEERVQAHLRHRTLEGLDDPPWLISATDLLIGWQPDPLALTPPDSTTGVWDRYFRQTPGVTAEPIAPLEPVQESWDSDAAAAAVDCLFRFIHALARADIDDAMTCVSPQYHTFENDLEYDVHSLRLRLERLLDTWAGDDVHVSLSEIPDPVFYKGVILIQITLQIDYTHKLLRRKHTDLLPGVMVFHLAETGGWLIAAVSPVKLA